TICEESHLAIETIGHGATKENHVTRLQNNSLRPVVRKLTMLGANNRVCEVSVLSITREGARITILARNLKNLEGAKTSIRLSTGIDDNIVSADVRDFKAVKEAVVSMGPIDVLVCDQGVFVSQELEKHEINEVKDMIDVNLVGTFNVVKAPFLGMKNRSDRKPVLIVFMSSQAGQVTGGGQGGAKVIQAALHIGEGTEHEVGSFIFVIDAPKVEDETVKVTPGKKYGTKRIVKRVVKRTVFRKKQKRVIVRDRLLQLKLKKYWS
ncbi:3-dehydrosphinganine reductase TSC10A-like protein, partial [Tanacetum coccineum]